MIGHRIDDAQGLRFELRIAGVARGVKIWRGRTLTSRGISDTQELMKTSILAVWLLCSLGLMAGGNKDDELVLQFNLQGSEADGPKISVKQDVAGVSVFFRVSPLITSQEVDSFRPFPADDGYSYGVMLQLNRTGKQRLSATTNANQGKLLLARVNGRPLDVVEIDKTINDGLLVIWKGITIAEIEQADKQMPRIGQTVPEWKKQQKEQKKKK